MAKMIRQVGLMIRHLRPDLFQAQPAQPASEFNAISNIGNFGGEIESARLDIAERLRRRTDSRQQSRLTLPNLIGDGEAKKNILADVL